MQGFVKVGGWSNAWKVYDDWGRVKLHNFMIPNPLKRLDFWSVIPLQTVMWTTVYGLMQASVQRYSSLPSKKYAIACGLGVMPGSFLFMGLSCLCGLVMFAYYAIKGCDPLVSGQITDVNQLLLHLVMEILHYPGIPGLFIAAVFCSSLSSLSSQLTAMAAFTWDDLLRLKYDYLSERKKTILLKILLCIFGFFSTAVGFLCLVIRGTLIKMVIMFTQAIFVPLGIIFINGAALPKLNLNGSLLSCLIASVVVVWMVVGGELYGIQDKPLPVPLSMCFNTNPDNETLVSTIFPDLSHQTKIEYISFLNTTENPLNNDANNQREDVFFMYRISHYWYGPIGLIYGLISSCILSFIPYFQEKVLIPENLIFPFVRCCFPTLKVSDDEEGNKEKPNNDITEISVFKPGYNDFSKNEAFLNTNKWLHQSPKTESEDVQRIYCL